MPMPRPHQWLLCLATLALLPPDPAGAQECTCADALDSLTLAVERAYAGYELKVTPWTAPHLDVRVAELRAAAPSTTPRDCPALLDRYVDWFDDGHLRVTQLEPDAPPWLPPARGERVEPESVRELIAAGTASGAAGGLEGFWRSPHGTVGVVPDGDGWRAVVLDGADTSAAGLVIARLGARDERGVHRATFAREGHLVEHRASPVGPSLLYFPEEVWSRPGAAVPDEPFAPRFVVLDERTALLRFPSMLPQHHPTLVELLHDDALRSRPDWIVDLRGNAGGSDGTYMPLLPLLYTDTIHTAPGAIRASPAARAHYARFIDPQRPEDAPPWVRELLDAMEAQPTGMIPGGAWNLGYDSVVTMPRRVAIVVDGSNGSSAETFLLKAIQSGKVRTFGRRTAGVVDYLNPTPTQLCRGSGLVLWSPTSIRQRFLPLDAIDPHGLQPDERIPEEAEDWIAWVHARMHYRP